jgi:nicotinamide riboside kinase
LAARLAKHYRALWVPEFVREYAERKGAPLDFSDHGPIARGQIALEDEYHARAMAHGAQLLIHDTDLLSTAVYCEHYYGRCPAWISAAAHDRRPDLYLLLDIDIVWAPDPQRDRPDRRIEMHSLFYEAVVRSGAPFKLIKGNADSRFSAAVDAIDAALAC